MTVLALPPMGCTGQSSDEPGFGLTGQLTVQPPHPVTVGFLEHAAIYTNSAPLEQADYLAAHAGVDDLILLDADGPSFTVRKTNIDGYFVLAPGEPEFIGQSGEEGDPSNFTVKYWPAVDKVGPLRIIVRGHYAYYGITGNSMALSRFREEVRRVWRKWLVRRKRGNRPPWSWFARLQERYCLPYVATIHAVCRKRSEGVT